MVGSVLIAALKVLNVYSIYITFIILKHQDNSLRFALIPCLYDVLLKHRITLCLWI